MATLATEIAAIAPNRHNLAIGLKVVHRFVTYRLDLDRRDNTVRQVVQGAVTIHMRLAKPALAMAQTTTPKAQIADHIAVFQRLLQQGFDQLIMLGHRGMGPNFIVTTQCNTRRCQYNHNDARGNSANLIIQLPRLSRRKLFWIRMLLQDTKYFW
jgi:hypothetical protein